MNVSPPVKARYEKNNTEGSITRGYLKVLISQVISICFTLLLIPKLVYSWNALQIVENVIQFEHE